MYFVGRCLSQDDKMSQAHHFWRYLLTVLHFGLNILGLSGQRCKDMRQTITVLEKRQRIFERLPWLMDGIPQYSPKTPWRVRERCNRVPSCHVNCSKTKCTQIIDNASHYIVETFIKRCSFIETPVLNSLVCWLNLDYVILGIVGVCQLSS